MKNLFSYLCLTSSFAMVLSCSNIESPTNEYLAGSVESENLTSVEMSEEESVEHLQNYLASLGAPDGLNSDIITSDWEKWLGVALVDAVGALTADSTQNRMVRTALFSLQAYEMLFNQHLDLGTTIINVLHTNAPSYGNLLPQTVMYGTDSIGLFHNAMIDSVYCNSVVMQNFFDATSGEKVDMTNDILISLGIGYTDSLSLQKKQEIANQAGVAVRDYLISDTYEDLASNLRNHHEDFSLSLQDINMIILYIQALSSSGSNHNQVMDSALAQLQLTHMASSRRISLRSAFIVGHASYVKALNLYDYYSSMSNLE